MSPELTIAPPEPEEPDEGGEEPDEGHGNEAAKWRRRLRHAEHERDELAAQVERLQRAEVERLADGAGIRAAALWAAGTELGALLAEDGTVDAGRVRDAARDAAETLGLSRNRGGLYVPTEGYQPPSSRRSGWEGAFVPKER